MTAAIVLGITLGCGILLVAHWWVSRRASLHARIAPHLRTAVVLDSPYFTTPTTPFPTLERLLAPVVRDGVRAIEKWGSSTHELRAKLLRAGGTLTVEQLRVEQVWWGLVGLVGGLGLAVLLSVTRGSAPLALAVLTLVCTVAGVAGREYMLGRAVTRREARMVAELPTVAELLALSVSAGEGALGALERVSRTTSGVLAQEMSLTLAHARTGTPLAHALQELADRSGVPALRRFADGIATAVQRGTPLAEVLRAQAQDVRASGRRALVEEGGKREIAMMIPVVFLILPVTVVFAVFPGIVAIQLGA